jgi:hypothetical protein
MIIYLTGPSRAGKTTLARRLGVPVLEHDICFERLVTDRERRFENEFWQSRGLDIDLIFAQYCRCWYLDNGSPKNFVVEGCSLGVKAWYNRFRKPFTDHESQNVCLLYGPNIERFKGYTDVRDFSILDSRHEAFIHCSELLYGPGTATR